MAPASIASSRALEPVWRIRIGGGDDVWDVGVGGIESFFPKAFAQINVVLQGYPDPTGDIPSYAPGNCQVQADAFRFEYVP